MGRTEGPCALPSWSKTMGGWGLAIALGLLGTLLTSRPARAADSAVHTWACYYGKKPQPLLARFDLVVLESNNLPPPVKRNGRPVALAYASLGEVDADGAYWSLVKGQPFVLRKNSNWNSYFVDIRDARWREVVLDRIIPDIVAKGYDGVFLDTLDSSVHLEDTDPKAFSGMTRAAVSLVHEIKSRFPNLRLCLNRAVPVLAQSAPDLDYALLEGLYSDYDGGTKHYRLVSQKDREALVAAAVQAQSANGKLIVLSLDYAAPNNAKRVRQAVAFSRNHGFVPYVATPQLDKVYTATLDN